MPYQPLRQVRSGRQTVMSFRGPQKYQAPACFATLQGSREPGTLPWPRRVMKMRFAAFSLPCSRFQPPPVPKLQEKAGEFTPDARFDPCQLRQETSIRAPLSVSAEFDRQHPLCRRDPSAPAPALAPPTDPQVKFLRRSRLPPFVCAFRPTALPGAQVDFLTASR